MKTSHHLQPPPGLTEKEFVELKPSVTEFHTYNLTSSQCSSLLAQHIHAPPDVVWSVIRRFDKPQIYKHFIKSCTVKEGSEMTEGCTRDVIVISGLPAATSTERLDLLDDEKHVMAFSIIGGEHRLRNYRAVTTVHEVTAAEEGSVPTMTVVLESYIVDVPEGNSEEDTRFFADTVVRLNLQKLASVTEDVARGGDAAESVSCYTSVVLGFPRHRPPNGPNPRGIDMYFLELYIFDAKHLSLVGRRRLPLPLPVSVNFSNLLFSTSSCSP